MDYYTALAIAIICGSTVIVVIAVLQWKWRQSLLEIEREDITGAYPHQLEEE